MLIIAQKSATTVAQMNKALSRRWRYVSMQSDVVNLSEKFSKFAEHWSPRVVAEMNDYQIKLAKFQGDFVWHDHKDTDEVFLVVKGAMSIELRDGTVHLSEGEIYVVPKGVEHRPFAEDECHVLLIEPRGVVNTGDSGGELQAENDVWV
ncbi:cupin domain-containing protein [Vreelandella venusta]|uniref:Cupin n=2 Tax=Vreelandella venusta TaxID=44935 RepID=A0ABX2BDE8_9GAMM|nr:cupin domain-containing protein [Halomonas venusta]NPT32150.1 cupin [Halomonas venusta]